MDLDRQPTAPVLNINGTSRESLAGQFRAVYIALQPAIDALADATPHGRDYQTASDGTYIAARGEHFARMQALHRMQAEMLALYRAVESQAR